MTAAKKSAAKKTAAPKKDLSSHEDPGVAAQILTDNKPVMIAARVHPRLQYGLRLLSRVQGGTIAEALEWAINLALRSTRIGSGTNETRLNKVVDAVWTKPTEPQRIHLLNDIAPELLDFEQRATWNLIIRCADLWVDRSWNVVDSPDGGPPDLVECATGAGDPAFDERVPKFELIEKHWKVLREVGVLLGRAGEIEQRYTLAEIRNGTALKRAGVDTPY